jgi:hypothetical protein
LGREYLKRKFLMNRIVYDYVDESSIDEELKCSIFKETFEQPVNTGPG